MDEPLAHELRLLCAEEADSVCGMRRNHWIAAGQIVV